MSGTNVVVYFYHSFLNAFLFIVLPTENKPKGGKIKNNNNHEKYF